MFIHSKGNFTIREKDKEYKIPIKYMGEVPSWVEKHWFFQALVKDGKITTFESKSDKEINQSIAKSEIKEKIRDEVAAEKRVIDDKIGQVINEVAEEAKKNNLDQTAVKNLTKQKVEKIIKKK